MKAETQLSQFKRYRHWLWFSLAYAIVLGVALVAIDRLSLFSSRLLFPIVIGIMYSIAGATTVMVGAWSVLGPGPLIRRFFISNLFGSIVLVGLIVSLFTQPFGSRDEFWYISAYFSIGFVVLSISAQIAFWFFRGIFGWQFVYRNERANASLLLMEIFVIVFMFAALSAMPNVIAKVTADEQIAMMQVGDTSYQTTLQPDGTYTVEEEIVTKENIERLHEKAKKDASSSSMSVVFTLVAFAAVVGLLSTPVVWFVFRSKTIARGLIFSLVYGMLAVVVPGLTISVAFSGTNFFLFETLATLLVNGFIASFLLCWPLSISRKIGFELQTKNKSQPLEAFEVDPLSG